MRIGIVDGEGLRATDSYTSDTVCARDCSSTKTWVCSGVSSGGGRSMVATAAATIPLPA